MPDNITKEDFKGDDIFRNFILTNWGRVKDGLEQEQDKM